MDLSLITVNTVIVLMLLLCRIGGMMAASPLFSMRSIPAQAKIGWSVALAILLYPFQNPEFVVPTDIIQFGVMGTQEVVLGLLIGFSASLVFHALQMAGEFVSVQMGLSMSSVMDPISGIQSPTIGLLYYYFALLVLLSVNAHHILIIGLTDSFKSMPMGSFIAKEGLFAERFIVMMAEMFSFALLVCVPVMGIMIVLEIALGFVAKVMPQMNIFMVGMPLKIGIGLFALAISLPYVSELLLKRYDLLHQNLHALFRGVA